MHDHVAVVECYPLRLRESLDVDRLHAYCQRDEPLDLVGERADLAVASSRRHDERVEGVHQCTQVEHHGVLADFLLGRANGRVYDGRDVRLE